jgi:hypothetical protein
MTETRWSLFHEAFNHCWLSHFPVHEGASSSLRLACFAERCCSLCISTVGRNCTNSPHNGACVRQCPGCAVLIEQRNYVLFPLTSGLLRPVSLGRLRKKEDEKKGKGKK